MTISNPPLELHDLDKVVRVKFYPIELSKKFIYKHQKVTWYGKVIKERFVHIYDLNLSYSKEFLESQNYIISELNYVYTKPCIIFYFVDQTSKTVYFESEREALKIMESLKMTRVLTDLDDIKEK